jgi:diguanylate cyclase (GGDEF)-like protein
MNILSLSPVLKQRMPSPTNVALAIMEACRRDDASTQEVVKLLQADPALTGRLLARANAASNGVRPVASGTEAVGRLGFQVVRQLTLTFSLLDQNTTGHCANFDYARFWAQALFTGLAMGELGALQRLGSLDELFTCGLLARIGCLALASAYPKEYSDVLGQADAQGPKLLQREQEVLQTDHIQLSVALLYEWGLPGVLVEPMAFQEQPALASFARGSRSWQLTQSLHLALQMAVFVFATEQEQAAMLPRVHDAGMQLGLKPPVLTQCMEKVLAQWMQWREILKLPERSVSLAGMTQAPVRPDQDVTAHWLRVLIVEDDPIVLAMLAAWLDENEQHTVLTAVNGKDGLAKAVEFKPHVILTDLRMPEMDGLALCQTLRESEWGKNIYVLMLTAADKESDLVAAFDAGVDDYLAKPVNMRALSARLKAAWRYVRLRDAWERDHQRISRMASELALSNRRLQLAALTDPLTDLANRRAGLMALTQSWSAATRHGQPLSLISIDVDHFKKINDQYGHLVGDTVLQAIAKCLKEGSRREDTVCRWGGEEFLIICPNLAIHDAQRIAERLRLAVAAQDLGVEKAPVRVTASFGLAALNAAMTSQDRLLSAADQALYAAKAAGRNCVKVE